MKNKTKRAAITLSTIILLSTPLKASAFDFGGFLSGFSGGFLEGLGLSKELVAEIDLYTEIGKTFLGVIQNKSLDSLFSSLPGILGKLGVDGGAFQECSDPSIGCDSLLGDAGTVDWEAASKKIQDMVYASTSSSDPVADAGPISAGITDPRFRPRITTQLDNTKIATWAQVQNTQYQALTGKEGQKLTKEGQESVNKIVEESSKTTSEIAKLDNTQDILKKGEVNKTLSISLQQRQILEQQQTRFAQYDGNQTAVEQLSIEQKAAWEKEVRQSQSLVSSSAEGDAFSDFITSAYAAP